MPKGVKGFTSESARAAAKAQKGMPRKHKLTVQKGFAMAFEKLQEDPDSPAHINNWSKENPTEFYKLATKLIPVQLTGEDGEEIKVKITGMKIT